MSERSWVDRLGSTAASVGAGVAGGAAAGPIGMAIGGVLGLARAATNEPHGEDEAPALAQAAQAITGIADQVQAVAAMEADPVKMEAFRLEALDVRARAQTARDAHLLAMMQTANADRAGARTADSERTGLLAYATLGVSAFILLLWALIMVASVFGRTPEPPITDDMATLRNLAIAVVAFWVGSSAGSVRKDDRLAMERRGGG